MRQLPHTEYSGYRGVGIRLVEPMLEDLHADASVGRDRQLLKGYHWFDKAHILMLGEEGLIPRGDAEVLLKALSEMESQGYEETRIKMGWGLHSGEQYLIRRFGYDIGGRIHLARSSGDLIAVARRIAVRDGIIRTMHGNLELREALLPFAIETSDAVMPGYTHGMHAQPTTLGAQIVSWVARLERDFQRFASAYTRTNESPAGAGIMTGAPFAVNRESTARYLGFDSVMYSTFDAIVGATDYFLESFSAAAILNGHLGKWAEDIAGWYSNESEMVDIPDRFCHTSSIMTHKKNPVALEQIRGSTADVAGGLASAFVANKGRSGGADGGGSSFFALLDAFDLVVRDMHWLALMVPQMEVKRDRMLDLASSHWAVAPDVASALVREKGLSWRVAHQIVGIMVRLARERGIAPLQATAELLDEASIEYMGKRVGLSDASLRKALSPVEAVNARTLYGGPAPKQTAARAVECQGRVHSDRKAVDAIEARLADAQRLLESQIATFVGAPSARTAEKTRN
jgi:argininosuccinate lyase